MENSSDDIKSIYELILSEKINKPHKNTFLPSRRKNLLFNIY